MICKDFVREEVQEWRAGMEERSVWWRTSADNRWEREGGVQNLKRVAMDCGSAIRFVNLLSGNQHTGYCTYRAYDLHIQETLPVPTTHSGRSF